MRGVINDLQAVLVGNLLDRLRVAGLAVAVHRHDRRCLGRYRRLDLIGVEAAVCRVNVHEHRLDAVPPQGVCRGHEAVGGRYHLACDAKGLECGYERERAVGEQAYVRHLEVFGKLFFKLSVELPVVGYPLAVPDLLQEPLELVEARQERGSYCYLLFVAHFV